MAEGLSGWECLKCGELNDHSYTECEDCGLTKDVAVRYIVQKRRKTCKECDHLHNELTYCHVYVEEGEKKEDGAGEDDDEGGEGENGEEDGEEEEEDDDDDDDDKDDDVLGVKEEKEEKLNFSNNKEEKKMVPLPTPAFVKNIKFIRCNCKVGVRNRSKFYEKFPQGGLYCENIQILTYEDITDPDKVERRKEKKRREREEMGGEEGEQKRKMDEIGVLLPLVLRFMHVGQCWVTAVAAKAWMTGTNNFRDYTDVRDMIPWKAYRAHQGQVDCLALVGHRIFSGGDRRVYISAYETGEVLHQVTRDSGEIPYLVVNKGDLYVGSANGSIRTFPITHNAKNIKLDRTMWEHSKIITKIEFGLPSVGPCEIHGINNHICVFYTSSTDRCIKIWNYTTGKMVATFQPTAIGTSTITALTQSNRHLFAGTSASSIMVITKFNICERDDIHACNTPGARKVNCLQLTLMLPPRTVMSGNKATVSALECTGPSYQFSHLWAADAAGFLTVWSVPLTGLEYTAVNSWKVHSAAITAMQSTWRHMASCGDDGNIILTCLTTFNKIRTLNVLEWCNYRGLVTQPTLTRRVKCISIQEDFENGGIMAVGTNYGEIVIMSIGTNV